MQSLEIVQQAYEYLNAKDLLNDFSLMSPEVEFYQTIELPWGDHYRGFEESKAFFAKFAPLIDSTVEIADYIPADEQIVAIGKTTGIAKQTGKPIQLQFSPCLGSSRRKNRALRGLH